MMSRFCRMLPVFFAVFFMWSSELMAAQVLVNIWDGTAYMAVRQLYNADKLPNLQSLGALGQLTSIVPCFANKCQGGQTRDQHATMLTGLDARQHLTWTLHIFQPIPRGLTIFGKLRQRIPGIKLAYLTGKCPYSEGTYINARPDIDVFVECKPTAGNRAYSPREVTDILKDLLRHWANDDWFIAANFKEPDSSGHQYGFESTQYKAAIISNDGLLGELLRLTPASAKVFVVADH